MICLMSLMSLTYLRGQLVLRETVGEQFSIAIETFWLLYLGRISLALRQLQCDISLALTLGVFVWKACFAPCLLTLGVQYAKPFFSQQWPTVFCSSGLLQTILLSIFSLSSWKLSGLLSFAMSVAPSFLLEYPFSKSNLIFSEILNSCSSFSSLSIFSLWSIFCMILSQLLSVASCALLAYLECEISFLEVQLLLCGCCKQEEG